MTRFEQWNLVLIAIGTFINLGALAFVGLQVRQGARRTVEATEARQKEWVQRHREGSLDFYLSALTQLDDHKLHLPPDRDRESIAEYLRLAEGSTERTGRIRSYLGLLELLSTAINIGVVDIEIVHRFEGPALMAAWRNYKPWVMQERAHRDEASLYVEFERLAKALNKLPPNSTATDE